MKMFRLSRGEDEFWFTAETADEAVSLASERFGESISLVATCDERMYPGCKITIKGVAVVRGPVFQAGFLFESRKKDFDTWVIDNGSMTQEIPREPQPGLGALHGGGVIRNGGSRTPA